MENLSGMKRFAVLLCAEDSDYVKKKYGGYFGVFVRMLAEDGEIWDVYRVCNGHFPSDEEIELYDGFVITGSCNDAHGNDVWICKLLVLLNKLDSLNKKVLGICFGHQILARSLGGKVTRAASGWDIGVRTVHFSTSMKTSINLKLPARLSLIECHQDEVRELPPKVEVLASSDKTKVEMFRYGDRIMGVQGHPEYTMDILTHLIDRLLQRGYIEEGNAIKGRASVDEHEPDREAWKQLCTSFLKGRL
ncbi:putative glutamine amidotransferase [Helianthus annuus]|uniref:Glutamine amidotransferase n=1 Tax=Helianthus annuus TaxID=4232 RepID=A0A251V7S0_HELAN|nr:gamma-glutamyl peptidase 5 [Helianthus annuus]KAF5813993.1 putative glutamine amidotransferase [Helianthus annuus]KAJ0592670.1 putative glutamine amidotransferase [Helianthus annuus]KAJ0600295.1 putative glutamine amidotransferase [Helianthus annuus]KAJ0607669.1 putative glutamine amidotransferase [Helianthus annuus]KAJ0767733.1 putative glutamine amidotransferase [Helianthus annuus]